MPQPMNLLKLLHRLWLHINSRRRIQVGLLFIIMILASFAEVVSIGAVLPFLGVLTAPDTVFIHPIAQPLIQFLNYTEPKQLSLPITILFVVAALLAGAMRLLLLWAQTFLSQGIGGDFSHNIYRRTLYQPYSVHVSRNSSEIIAGVRTKADILVQNQILPSMVIVSSIMMLIAIIAALIAIEPVMAISAFLGFGIIYGIVIKLTENTLIQSSQRINEDSIQVIKSLQEGLGGVRDVLIDGTQDTYSEIYSRADRRLRRTISTVNIISASPRFGVESLGMVLIAVLAYYLTFSSGGILNAIPVLGALALGAQRILPVLQAFYASVSAIRSGQSSLVDALELLDQPLPDYADTPSSLPILFERSITLDNLAFKYSENMPWVLKKGLNLSIPKGSRIGFIGSTGSGKTTLLDIIMGLLKPSAGSLMIDGINITEQNHRAWQAHIAHVPQAIFLADTSILENIAFGVPIEKIDHARAREAAQKAQIAQTIESLNKQYNSLVGEQGVRLSGGQRQRIGIARALYKKADVIVFDEATSALDNDTELAVMDAIENLGDELTVIIVAHRLTTLRNCTQIVKLVNGEIDRIGSYQEIVE